MSQIETQIQSEIERLEAEIAPLEEKKARVATLRKVLATLRGEHGPKRQHRSRLPALPAALKKPGTATVSKLAGDGGATEAKERSRRNMVLVRAHQRGRIERVARGVYRFVEPAVNGVA